MCFSRHSCSPPPINSRQRVSEKNAGIITFLAYIAVLALLPLFMGLVQAAFYEEITNPTIPQAPVYNAIPQAPVYAVPAPQAPVNNAAPQAPKAFCPECGAAYPSEAARFCIGCGKPRA